MTKAEIVGSLAKERFIEKCFRKMKICQGESQFNLNDLSQDLYFSLLDKDDELITGLYDRQELAFYVTAMITNMVMSKSSPYYINYKNGRLTDIDTIKENTEGIQA